MDASIVMFASSMNSGGVSNNNNKNPSLTSTTATTTPAKQLRTAGSSLGVSTTTKFGDDKSPISPAQERILMAIQKERDVKDSLRSISTHSSGIIDYLHRRKQVCYCRYSSVIKRQMLELDHRRRQQQQQQQPQQQE